MVISRSGLLSSLSPADSRMANGSVAVHVGDAVRHQDDVVVGSGVGAAGAVRETHAEVKAGLNVRRAVRGKPLNRPYDIAVVRVIMPDREVVDDVVGEVDDGDAVPVRRLRLMLSAASLAMSTRFPSRIEPEASSTRVTLTGVLS